MIRDTTVFLLPGIAQGFDPANDVTEVYAQYTATLTGTSLAGPEPSAAPDQRPTADRYRHRYDDRLAEESNY
jgi:hypothetical protein